MKKKKKEKQFLAADEQDDSVIEKNKIGDFKSFFYLIGYFQGRKLKAVGSLLSILLGTLCILISARLLGFFVEKGLIEKNWDLSLKISFFIIALEIASLLFQWKGREKLSEIASLIILEIRKKVFKKLQILPISYYDRRPQGRIVTRITHDIEGIDNFFTESLGRILNSLFMASLSILAMSMTNLKLSLLLILSILPALLFVFFTRKKARAINRKMSLLSSKVNSKLAEFINGIDVIRFFGIEKWSNSKYTDASDELLESQKDANLFFGIARPTISLLCSLPLLFLVWFGGHDVMEESLSIGIFIAFIRYCDSFFRPIMMLARELHIVQAAFTNSERVSGLLNEETEDITLGKNGKIGQTENLPNLKGDIEFRNISMKYGDEGEWVLKDLSFFIKSGEVIGLVGESGCGKTTTVSLLARLYEFQKGSILIDNISIKDFDRNFLRSSIGFVTQDVILFRGTLRDNLSLEDHYDDLNLLESCQQTGLLSVIKERGISLDSLVLEGGSNFSSGEQQLISLTRVLVHAPKILILDEATANIDPKHEKILHDAIEIIMKDRTCLIIAHRLETLSSCHRILVFKKGELVEEGTEEKLLRNKGHYFRLHQAKKEA